MRKIIALLLVMILTGSVVTGCGKSEGAVKTESQQSTAESSKAPVPATELSVLVGSNSSWPYNENWWIWKALEEATGVRLKASVVDDATWDEKLNITMASGTLPDLIFMYDLSAKTFGRQGALEDLAKHMDKMPNFKKWSEANPEIFMNSHDADGGLYIAESTGLGDSNRMGWIYRDDIFKKHNLTVPTNSDEFYSTLVQLKKLYPDSYPFVFRGNGNLGKMEYTAAQWNASLYAYAFYPDPSTKKIKYGPVESNYKDMLTFYNKLYTEKLIPPDFLTLDTKAWTDLISNNKAFITSDYLVRIDFFNNQIQPQNPEFNMKYMEPFKGLPDGQNKFTYTAFEGAGYTVTSTGKKIDTAIKFLDYLYSEEGKELTSWGKEGETYKVEGGEKKFIDCKDSTEMRIKYGLSTNGASLMYDFNATLTLCTPGLKEAYTKSRNFDANVPIDINLNAGENTKVVNICDQLLKRYQEETIKFIMGKKSFGEWDNYVSDMKALGLDEVISVYQGAYDRMSSK